MSDRRRTGYNQVTVADGAAGADDSAEVSTIRATCAHSVSSSMKWSLAMRGDVTEEELVAALREPGVVYVRKDVLSD